MIIKNQLLIGEIKHFNNKRKEIKMAYPDMIPVSSSNIDSVGYDEPNQEVYIRFLNGGMYKYIGVSLNEFENLRDAASVGSYLNRYYKNVYSYEKIE